MDEEENLKLSTNSYEAELTGAIWIEGNNGSHSISVSEIDTEEVILSLSLY